MRGRYTILRANEVYAHADTLEEARATLEMYRKNVNGKVTLWARSPASILDTETNAVVVSVAAIA